MLKYAENAEYVRKNNLHCSELICTELYSTVTRNKRHESSSNQ